MESEIKMKEETAPEKRLQTRRKPKTEIEKPKESKTLSVDELKERKSARAKVISAIYAKELSPKFSADLVVPESQQEYANVLMENAKEKRRWLEDLIGERLRADWSYERISPVVRAILKVAIIEMLFVPDVGTSTAISEAVKLAKKYSDIKASKFVNGILGSIARSEGN
jgi:N utilization substance protein B